jgi:hypothetical protein
LANGNKKGQFDNALRRKKGANLEISTTKRPLTLPSPAQRRRLRHIATLCDDSRGKDPSSGPDWHPGFSICD